MRRLKLRIPNRKVIKGLKVQRRNGVTGRVNTRSSWQRPVPLVSKVKPFHYLEEAGVRSQLQAAVPEPKSFKKAFLKPVLHKFGEFVRLAVSGAQNEFITHFMDNLQVQRDEPKEPNPRLAISDASHTAIAEKTNQIRVKKADDGFLLTIPLGGTIGAAFDFSSIARSVDTYMPWGDNNPEANALKQQMIEALNKFPGPALFDISQAVDHTYRASDAVETSPWFDPTHSDLAVSKDSLALFKKYVKMIRLMSPPLDAKDLGYGGGLYNESDINKESPLTSIKDAANPIGFAAQALNSRDFFTSMVLHVPAEYAEYIIQTPFAQAEASDMLLWSQQWIQGLFKKGEKWQPRMNPIRNIRDSNSDVQGDVKPRVNEDGLSITFQGDLVWIPTSDNVDAYDQEVKDFASQHGGEEVTFQDVKQPSGRRRRVSVDEGEEPVKPKKLPANMLVYTDWVNNRLAYTDTSAALKIWSLEGFASGQSTAIASLLERPLFGYNEEEELLENLGRAANRLTDGGTDLNSFMGDGPVGQSDELLSLLNPAQAEKYSPDDKYSVPWGLRNILGGYFDMSPGEIVRKVHSAVRDLKTYYDYDRSANPADVPEWVEQHSSMDDWKLHLVSSNSPVPALRPLGRMVEAAWKLVEGDPTAALSGRSVLNGMKEVAQLLCIAKYASKYDQVVAADLKRRQPYIDPQIDPNAEPTALPYVEGFSFLPHQMKTQNYLVQDPQFAILDVSPGGGKTILILTDLIRLVQAGKVTRGIILCPGYLVRNYIEDGVFLFKGKMNMIPITTQTFRQYGEEGLQKVLEQAPRNTIVVSDYDFIKGRVREESYGPEPIKIGDNSEMLRSFGFDYIALDESHNVKNPASTRSQVTQRLAADIPYRRLATGTFVTDQMTDIVGQFNMIDPATFGNRKKFIEAYASDWRGGKVLSWKPDAERKIAQRVGQFSNLVTIKRKEWAALLPKRVENFHFVKMRPNQRTVYDSILKQTLELIAQNEDLLSKLRSGDEVEAENIEFLLRPYMQRMEKFLSAPAMDHDGEALLKDPADQVSPKAMQVTKLCNQHISQGIPGKILVFCGYNRSADAMYEGLPPDLQSRALRYHASEKAKHVAQFMKDDRIQILIGVGARGGTAA